MTQFLGITRPVPVVQDFVFVGDEIPRPPFYEHFIVSNNLFYNHSFSFVNIMKIHDEVSHLIREYNDQQQHDFNNMFLVVMEDTFFNGDNDGQPCLSFILSQYYREHKKLCGLYFEHDDFSHPFIDISTKINAAIINTFMKEASQAEKSLSHHRFIRRSNNMVLQVSDKKLCKLQGILLA